MKAIYTFVISVLLVSCATNKTVSEQPSLPEEGVKEYLIGVGDSLSVMVWKSPELSLGVSVRPDGKISAPLVGDLMAKGYTAEALATQITAKLENYIRNPLVTVIVTNPASADFLRRVRVTGAVGSPLSVSHRQGMTVLDIVLQAGGLTEFARGNSAKLYRTTGGEMKAYPIYLKDILERGQLDSNYLLAPGDIITVPEKVF